MSGIFGIEERPARGTAEHRLRSTIKQLAARLDLAAREARRARQRRTRGALRPDAPCRGAARPRHLPDHRRAPARRGSAASAATSSRCCSRAKTEDGELLSDRELRDELLTLVLAGFETTANSLAWTWERLLRTPAAYERLRDAVRSGERGRGARRGDDRRGHALAPGDPDHRPSRHRAVAARRLRRARGTRRSA